MSTQPVTLDMSTAQPIAPKVTLDMSTAQPIANQAAPDQGGVVTRFLTGATGLPIKDIEEHPNQYLDPFSREYWDTKSSTPTRQAMLEAAKNPIGHPTARSMIVPREYDQAKADIQSGNYAGAIGDVTPAAIAVAQIAGPKVTEAIADHPAFIKASNAIKQTATAPVRLAARTAETVANQKIAPIRPILNINTPADEAEAINIKIPGRDFGLSTAKPVYPGAKFPEPADAALGRIPVRQPTPLEQSEGMAQGATSQTISAPAQVYRDATRQNVPYAGELDEMSDRLAQQIAAKKGNESTTAEDHLQAKSVLDDALKSSTDDVVDSAIKPGGQNHGTNLQTKAQVDFHLQRGDVASAENALDSAVQAVSPGADPSQLFTARTGKVPSTMEIRQRVATEPGSPADIQETRGIQEQMRDNLQRHQWSAESEARREFIARNSTGYTKTWGTQAQRDAAHATAMAADSGDMTDLLEKSLAQVRSQK